MHIFVKVQYNFIPYQDLFNAQGSMSGSIPNTSSTKKEPGVHRKTRNQATLYCRYGRGFVVIKFTY